MTFAVFDTAFVGATVVQHPFGFTDFLEYAIFALLLVLGVVISKKTDRKAVKILGVTMAVTGGIGLGWQIVIRLFFV